jgi:hypothetical protein
MPKVERDLSSSHSFMLLMAEHTKIRLCYYNVDRKELRTFGVIPTPLPSTQG